MADDKLIGRIEQVRDTLQDRLIQLNRDIRTEFEDLKNDLPEVLPEPEPPAPPPPPPPVEDHSLVDLIAAMDQVHQAVTQVDLLKALVQGSGSFLPRVLLLIKKAGNLHGWASRGFSDDFASGRLKKLRWQVDQYPELKRVIEGRVCHAANFSDLSDIADEIESFDGFVPFKSCFYPLVVKNKVAAVLYTDSGAEPHLKGSDKVQLLVHTSGLELTLVAAKAKVAPKRSPRQAPVPEPAPEPVVAPEPSFVEEPTPTDSSFVSRMEPDFDPPPAEPQPSFNEPPVPEPAPFNPPEEASFDAPSVGYESNFGSEPDDFASEPDDFASSPDDFASSPDDFASKPDDFASKPDDFASEPDDFASEPDDFASEPDDFASEPDDFASEPDDFATEPPVPRFDESPEPDFAEPSGFDPLPEPAFEASPEPPPPPPPAPEPAVEEDPLTKKARRAARVLVSDLKLYNEAQVAAALKSADLYKRIKEDIDRSHQHYKERIADLNAPTEVNFFKEEIIRQLAGGDASLLGPLPF